MMFELKFRVIRFFTLSIAMVFFIVPYFGFSSSKVEAPIKNVNNPKFGGIYRRGLGHEPATLDPARITDVYEVIVTQQIFEGLVQYGENLMVIPCIAESWTSSRDNLKWVFYLKKGVKFHNGREVIADDFVYSFTRILKINSKSETSSFLLRIKGAKEFVDGKAPYIAGLVARGKYKLEITLGQPFPPFIAVLAMVNFSVVPREEIELYGKEFGKHPVGSGPFVFDHWIPDKEIVLKANKDYHEGRPYLDRVNFMIFSGSSADNMFKEFENDKLDDSLVPINKRHYILENPDKFILLHRPSLNIRMFVMNNRLYPFNNKLVRKALNYAIDKKTLSEKIGKGRLIPAVGFLPPGMAGYQEDDTNYPYNPEEARKLLKKAGFPEGKGLPVLQFWSSVKSKALLEEDKVIKRYLGNVGVKVHFNYLTDWPFFKKLMTKGKLPVFKYSWSADVPDPDNILSSLFYSKSPTNRSFYHNSSVDELIVEAQRESNYVNRIGLYSKIQDIVMNDAPVILLNYLAFERVFKPYVRNYEGNALGDHYFSLKRIWLDKEE